MAYADHRHREMLAKARRANRDETRIDPSGPPVDPAVESELKDR
ncbi:hypothetical protein VAR608DRAFT_2210 [Variovorax sp. HW608]|nr:hypothetical protein [Variovorax sp. HW608]SCK26943.1 hypothetical protein VAR608DRAFT_2210 [Variovorax sp. HW608]